MARTGLYKSEVKKARDAILVQGKHPSVDAVRIVLGNTGSKTTIHKYLKELEEDGDPQGRKVSISDALHDLVERLAGQLEDEANERIAGIEKQQAEMGQAHAHALAALEASIAAVKAELIQSHEAMAQETQSHAQTHELLQKETITHHTLEQQVADLKERLAENDIYRLSLEEKHRHAREALEHYRESVREQRDQDIRRHEHQVQQLQGEIRLLQQSLVHKQNEITGLNQDGARLVAELSQAQKSIYDLQSSERKQFSEIESLKVTTSRAILLESESAAKDVAIGELRSQLIEISTQTEILRSQLHEQQLELVKSLAIIETQKTMMANLQDHFGISNSKNE